MSAFQLSRAVSPSGETRPAPVMTTRRLCVIIPFYYQAGVLTAESEGV